MPKPSKHRFAEKLIAWQGDRTDAEAAEALGANLRTYHGWKSADHAPVGVGMRAILEIIEAKPSTKKHS